MSKWFELTIEDARQVLQAEWTAYGEGMDGPPENLIRDILKEWPELYEESVSAMVERTNKNVQQRTK